NPIAYFGYRKDDGTSQPMMDSLCSAASASFAKRIAEEDSTGQWKLRFNGDLFQNPFIPNYFDPAAYLHHWESPSHCYEDPCGTFIDERDGIEYKMACIGDRVWMAENLRYAGAGVCYEENPVNCVERGRFYTIEELTGFQQGGQNNFVQGLCPNGWHVPTDSEWQNLFIDAIDGAEYDDFYETAAELLCDNTIGIWLAGSDATDAFGFSVQPIGTGYFNLETSEYGWGSANGLPATAFWTSNYEDGDFGVEYQRRLFSQQSDGSLGISGLDGYNGPEFVSLAQCRCVQDY
ncbi:MAG: FISUMP domain-containing protein, partial [Bacteroidota bacterium]